MLLLFPVGFKFSWRQITECGVDALMLIDLLDELANLCVCVGETMIIRQVHLLFFDGAYQPLSVAVLPGFSFVGHADLDVMAAQ